MNDCTTCRHHARDLNRRRYCARPVAVPGDIDSVDEWLAAHDVLGAGKMPEPGTEGCPGWEVQR
jgi:hypothetical protein